MCQANYIRSRLEGTHRALDMLSPQNQELAVMIIRELGRRDGNEFPLEAAPGLQSPKEGLDMWQSDLELRGLAYTTRKSYRQKVESLLHVYPEPTELEIRQYLTDRLREGLDKGTIANYIKAFRSFFSYLHETGLWNYNPAAHLRLPKLTRKEKRCPNNHDIAKLLSEQLAPQDRIFLLLSIDCGLRLNEIATVKRADVDLTKREVIVMGKGGKERSVPICEFTALHLAQYLRTVNSQYLFPALRCDTQSGHFSWRAFQRRLERLCRKVGIAHITPHQLRHYFATYALSHGGDVKAVSEILGHRDVTITLQTYHHVGRRAIRQVHSQVSPLAAIDWFEQEPLLTKDSRHALGEALYPEAAHPLEATISRLYRGVKGKAGKDTLKAYL